MNASEMQAGRELDALLAERLMGWTRDDRGAWVPPGFKPLQVGYYTQKPGAYSTSIAAAWEVVEKMAEDWFVDLTLKHHADGRESWCVSFDNGARANYGEAPRAPLAIVRAALAALEVDP